MVREKEGTPTGGQSSRTPIRTPRFMMQTTAHLNHQQHGRVVVLFVRLWSLQFERSFPIMKAIES